MHASIHSLLLTIAEQDSMRLSHGIRMHACGFVAQVYAHLWRCSPPCCAGCPTA